MIIGVIRADDHLGALAGGRVGPQFLGKLFCRHWRGMLFRFRFAPIFVLFDFVANPAHGLLGALDAFFGREFVEGLLVGQLNVD